jgi:hypothetical protein
MAHLVIVAKLSAALFKMPDPVETCILKLQQEELLYSTPLDRGRKHTWSIHFADILLQIYQQKLETAVDQHLIRLLLVHPELWFLTFILVEKEVAKQRVV